MGVVGVRAGDEGCDGEDGPFVGGEGGCGLEGGFEGLEERGVARVEGHFVSSLVCLVMGCSCDGSGGGEGRSGMDEVVIVCSL